MNFLAFVAGVIAVVIAVNKAMTVTAIAIVGIVTYIITNLIIGTFRVMVIRNL